MNIIEDEQDNYINMFIDILKAAFNNDDIKDVLSIDMPNMVKVLKTIRKRDNYRTKWYELTKWLHDWLTYVSYEEDDFKEMTIYLEKEILKWKKVRIFEKEFEYYIY